jgi:hypothetical protein
MAFKIIVRNWVDGNLQGFEENADSLEEAMAKVSRHDEHHRKHSQGHLIKILNENGEVVHSITGSPDPVATESYA